MPRAVRVAMVIIAAAVLAIPVAYRAAGWTFDKVFNGYDNHDTAAPLLIAFPAAMAAFLVSAGGIFALAAFLLGLLLRVNAGKPGKG
ncbi:MAG TPA: hypothetical protein VMF29_02020 [Candidatus Edwardsbacteria bacterium]|nr:hypothetical protein [Candidatus Edwardsbacteria bacterium]